MRLLYIFIAFAQATLLGLRTGTFLLGENPLTISGVFVNLQAPNSRVLQYPAEIRSLSGTFESELDPGVLALEFSASLQRYLCVFYNGTVQIYEENWTLVSERVVIFPEPILEGVCAWNAMNGSFWLLGKENLLRVDATVQLLGPSANIADLRWNGRLELLDTSMQFAQFAGCPCEVVQPRYLGEAGSIVSRTQQQLSLGYTLLDVDEVIAEFPDTNISSSWAHRPNLVIDVDVQYYIAGFSHDPIVVEGTMEIHGGTLVLHFDEPVADGETLTLYTFANLQRQFDDIVVESIDSCTAYDAEPSYTTGQIAVTITVASLCSRGARFGTVLICTNL